MSGNEQFEDLPHDMFTSLQLMKKLDISDCGLTTLPNRYVLYTYIHGIIIIVE